ncbi:MAG: hypothetical protein GXP61_04700 [Epsilonproteobacteria bacterium]|nr:hypothetical protein [Campylobacterota bacterium]
MKKTIIISLLVSGVLYASNDNMENNFHKGQMMSSMTKSGQMINHMTKGAKTPLLEAGNDAFGTIQEVIRNLKNDPNTDWSKVNIEALRAHLSDMEDITLNIKILSQKNIPNGVVVIIKPTTPRAYSALKKVFQAHPRQLKKDTGWDMRVEEKNKNFTITITTSKKNEVNEIRGLGYIGIMAYGSHHQLHHWMMAKGMNPHK